MKRSIAPTEQRPESILSTGDRCCGAATPEATALTL